MKSMSRIKICLLFMAAFPAMSGSSRPAAQAQQPQRPFRIEDQWEKDEILLDYIAFSPDGQAFAFTKFRPWKTLPPNARTILVPVYALRSDVWVQEAPGRPARNLTNGQADGSGWWALKWSPDGQRLAFLSTRGGNVTMWAWERATDQVRQLSTQGVDFNSGELFHWVDNHHLLCLAMPEGETSPPVSDRGGQQAAFATAAWAKAARGEVTASVVNSLEFNYPKRRLFLLDVTTGMGRAVTETLNLYSWLGGSWRLSPNGQAVAVVRPVPARYGAEAMQRMGAPRSVELCLMDGRTPRLDKPLPDNVLATTIRWSLDGKELAFFAYGDAPINPLVLYGPQAAEVMPEYVKSPEMSLENPAKLYRVNLEKGQVEQIETGEIDLGYLGAPTFTWTTSGELVFHAPRRRYGATTLNNFPINIVQKRRLGPEAPQEWWVLGRDGRTRPLTTDMKSVPASLQAIDGGAAFIGLSEGDVWRIDPVSGTAKNVSAKFTPRVSFIPAIGDVKRHTHIVIAAGELSDRDRTLIAGGVRPSSDLSYYVLDLGSGEGAPLKKPAPNASVTAFDPQSRSAVYYADDRTGSYLWRGTGGGTIEKMVEANTFRRGIAKVESKVIEFTSLNGEKLKAGLYLPYGYKPGQRVPLIVNVYMGYPPGALVSGILDPQSAPGSQGDLVGSAGYAYLHPVIPRNLPGLDKEEGASIQMLSNAIMPAVEKAIAIGVADPERLFVMGHSFGGWSTVGVLGQTNRFKAAFAGSGVYNYQPFGQCGSVSGSEVFHIYTENPHEYWLPNAGCSGYAATDVPWWRDGERLRRNSPLNYVERVQTPLLLTHGDLDPVSFSQSQELFRALVSMRKRAQFVRYWGEGHAIGISNLRDVWQRTFAWFDDFGDIARDANGNMIFEVDRVKSRGGAPALKPEDFARFDMFLGSDAPRMATATNGLK